MPLKESVLCPVDFSGYSAAALKTAGNFARSLDADVIVLHAERVDAPVYFTAAQTQALKKQLRQSRTAAQRHLSAFADEYLPEEVPRSLKVVEDDPVRAILREVRESGAGWVVMGTHGRTGLTKVRFGSVMETVLAKLSAPMITVGPRVKRNAALGMIRRVLCAVDYSKPASSTLSMAAALSEKLGAELVVAHVVESAPEDARLEPERQSLCDWIKPSVRERCSVREVVQRGNPAEQIVRLAEEQRAGLVVVSAQPRSFLGGLFLGSNVRKIVHNAPCPVLSFTPSKEQPGPA